MTSTSPYRQAAPPTNYLVLRGPAPPAELLALVRRTLKSIDPAQAIAGEATLGQMIERHTARSRFNVWILLLFAAGALLLAAAGIHSVIRESVAVRSREIAIKNALGATRTRLVAEAIRGALLVVALGELAGLAGALYLGRGAADLLYGVSAADPGILLAVAVLVFTIAAVASFFPAWLASGQDPRTGLQAE